MSEGFQRHWAELAPLLDEALALEPSEREAWLSKLSIDTTLKDLLREALSKADAAHPLLDAVATDSALFADAGHAERWVGKHVAQWEITGFLGQGGMAAVFAVRRRTPPHQLGALKLMQRGLFTESERAQFMREQEILSRLEHPGVARLIDAGLSVDGIPFLVMELVSGRPIDQYCREEQLTLRQRVALLVRVCEVIAYAQRALVVHRDLKPEHLIVLESGAVKVLDFGIAKLVGDTHVTRTYARQGTPRYAAPEQARGEPITTATDVYSLARIATELFADAGDTLSRDLKAVLAHALNPDADARYASAAEFSADLRAWLAGRQTQARPLGRTRLLGRFMLRHWVPVAAVLAVLVSLGVGLVQANREAARADAAAAVARVAEGESRAALERAQSLNAFVIGLFRADIADLPRDEMPTVRQLVDVGLQQARDESSGPPWLRASMLVTLGNILRVRVQWAEAEAAVEEALRLLEPVAQQEAETYVEALLARGLIALGRRDDDLEVQFVAQALAHAKRYLPASRIHFEARRAQALLHYRRADIAAARRALESLDAELRERPELADILAKTATDMAIMYKHSGELVRAERAFATVLEQSLSSGEPTMSVVYSLNNLADAKAMIGDFDASDALLERALASLAGMEDKPLQVRAVIWDVRAENAQRRGDFDTAFALRKISAEHWVAAVGLKSIDEDGFYPLARAQIYADAGQNDLALENMDVALKSLAAFDPPRPVPPRFWELQARLACAEGDIALGNAALRALQPLQGVDPSAAAEAKAQCALAEGDAAASQQALGEGALIKHPEAIGLAADSARRHALRAQLRIQLGDPDGARDDIQTATAQLDAVGVWPSHPLRTRLAELDDELDLSMPH